MQGLNFDSISREAIDILKEYQKLVLKWSQRINLISKSTESEFWLRHVVDALQLLRFIEDQNIHLVDLGSGAGIPGIILSIAGVKTVTLIESDARKSAFLLQASKLSSNKIEIINERIENIYFECDILTARAVADLNTIFSYISNNEVRNKSLLLKGETYDEELKKAKKNWLFEYNIYDSFTFEKGKILEIKNLVKK